MTKSQRPNGIAIKRAYEPVARADGCRVLVDGLWPRGLSKDRLHTERWCKELAPSAELRHWFGHEEERWPEFRRRYFEELAAHQEELEALRVLAAGRRLTLVYGARDEQHNNAVALRDYLQTH